MQRIVLLLFCVFLLSGCVSYKKFEDLQLDNERLNKELADTETQMKRLEQLLAGEFAQKAPAAVISRERERLAALKETAAKLKAQIK